MMKYIYKVFLFYLFNMTFFKMMRSYRLRYSMDMNSVKNNIFNSQQYIITNTNQRTFGFNEKETYMNENKFIEDKKIISISPGGFKGVYMLGVCMYIKDHYDLENYIFSGASAGAWNSLVLCCKKDVKYLKEEIVDYSIKNSNTIIELENLMKTKILQYYTTDDFDLRRLFIGVTTLNGLYPETTIYSDFNNLEDAINCCIASSHIPLITGGIINRYHNKYTFDGGFSRVPYLNIKQNVLHITPSMWKHETKRNTIGDINEFTTLFSKNKYNFSQLFLNGYEDAEKHKDFLETKLNDK